MDIIKIFFLMETPTFPGWNQEPDFTISLSEKIGSKYIFRILR